MASLFSHPAFPVAVKLAGNNPLISWRLTIVSILLTLLPDADVISFYFGVAYASQWGHRGFTHSILFALLVGVLCVPFSSRLKSTRPFVFWLCFLSTLSHPVFDALTNGGLGVAFFWPLSQERYFLPFHPVEVSPLGVRNFFTLRGLQVLLSECLWIWLPCLFLSVQLRRRNRQG